MPRFSDKAREQMIDSGRGKGYGDITSREMGAMGGTTTRNLTRVAKAVLEGNSEAVDGLTADEVFVKKDNKAGVLDLDLKDEQAPEGGAPEAQTRRAVAGRRTAKA